MNEKESSSLHDILRNGWSPRACVRPQYIPTAPIYKRDGQIYWDENKAVPEILVNIIDPNEPAPDPRDLRVLYGNSPLTKNDEEFEVQPHVAENDNTRVVMPPVGRRAPESKAGSSFMDGVESALKESKQAIDYIGSEVRKQITTDPEERAKIEAQQDSIVKENSEMPETRGMGTAGSVATNIVTTALPPVIAGMIGGPVAAGIVGGGMMAFDATKTGVQANIEMDAYEKTTGKKIDDQQRVAYTTASIATDAIMNAMMGSKLLSGVSTPIKKSIGKELKERIMQNPVAQAEFNTMTRNVVRQERDKWAGTLTRDVASSAIEGGVASGALEAEKSIYTEQAPELNNIVSSVLSGTLTGAMQGGVSTEVKRANLHRRRNTQDDTFYVSNTTNQEGNGRTPISEFRPEKLQRDAEGNIVAVEGRRVDPSGASGAESFPVDNVSTGSYREAHRRGATTDVRDNWEFTDEQMSQYQSQWDEAMKMKEKDPEKSYDEQNRVVQSIAAEMGIPINVYARVKDLPPELRDHPEVKKSYAVTVNDNTINVVLDQCEGLSAKNLASIIRHEGVGHFGMNKTYSTREDYEKALNKAGTPLVPQEQQSAIPTPHSKAYAAWLQRLEERASRKAETREYINETDANDMYNDMYKMLRKSEDNIRSTTVNELKKNSQRRGNPMPTIYELEQK